MADFGRDGERILQGDFRTCECFARGLVAAGVHVTSAHCNQAGDIASAHWLEGLESAPFFESMVPVYGMTDRVK
jgi:hypothetical protein